MSVDLTTRYLGLTLKNPVVVAACSIAGRLDVVRRMEDAGASAIVLPSLFEEQIEHEEMAIQRFYERGTESFAESLNYFPEVEDYTVGPDSYLDILRRASEAVDIPVIGSLNGISSGGWVEYAHMMEQAGADAIELNIYNLPIHPDVTAQELEDAYVELVRAVRAKVQVPIAIKLSPFFTALPNMARRLVEAGANSLVLFNRFYQPDIDVDAHHHADPNRHRHADRNGHVHSYADIDPDTDDHGHADPDSDVDRNAYVDSHANRDSDADANGHLNGHRERHSHREHDAP